METVNCCQASSPLEQTSQQNRLESPAAFSSFNVIILPVHLHYNSSPNSASMPQNVGTKACSKYTAVQCCKSVQICYNRKLPDLDKEPNSIVCKARQLLCSARKQRTDVWQDIEMLWKIIPSVLPRFRTFIWQLREKDQMIYWIWLRC